jgi:glycosyltransferase involved in cell wall biosynthesis
VPAGLRAGLSSVGVGPVPIDARFPGSEKLARLLRLSWAQATASNAYAAASTLRTNRTAQRANLAGVVALSSGFTLSNKVRAVTFEDMTVAQALRRDDPEYRSVSAGAARRWRARQLRNYERSHACCVSSSWVAESVHRDYGVPLQRIRIVGLGRNVESAPNPERDWSTPRFIFSGIAWERKRGAAVLDAFAVLRERDPSATLDLVGGHPPLAAEGVTAHGRLRLDSESDQRRYAELLRRSTCFVMPSAYEPFGIAHVDAAAAGVPSIGTTVGGVRDAIGPGGVLVDPGDDEALLEAMLDMSDPYTAQRLGQLAQGHSTLYTWRAVAERVLRALEPAGVEVEELSDFLPLAAKGEGT